MKNPPKTITGVYTAMTRVKDYPQTVYPDCRGFTITVPVDAVPRPFVDEKFKEEHPDAAAILQSDYDALYRVRMRNLINSLVAVGKIVVYQENGAEWIDGLAIPPA